MSSSAGEKPFMPSDEDIKRIQEAFKDVQDHICKYVTASSGQVYCETAWDYEKGQGGGRSRVWEVDRHHTDATGVFSLKPESRPLPVIERGACNFSGIRGTDLPESAVSAMKLPPNQPYHATGVSLIFHSSNAYVPTIHMNIRFFKCGEKWWFGGGVDVTPNYPILDQVVAFHRRLKAFCDTHGRDYDKLKERCDEYFYLAHRKETRGVGGLFWDAINSDFEADMAFTVGLGMLFTELYAIFLEGNKYLTFTQEQREFVLYRRGRYVEFNLLYDRGTKFGIMSEGRTESILVSMPATVHWVGNYVPPSNSMEAYLYDHFLKGQPWLQLSEEQLKRMQPPPHLPYAKDRANTIQTEPVGVTIPERRCCEEVERDPLDDEGLGPWVSIAAVSAAVAIGLVAVHKVHCAFSR